MAVDFDRFKRSRTIAACIVAACVLAIAVWPVLLHALDAPKIAAFSSAAPGAPPQPWRFATLPRKTPTRYTIVGLDGENVLRVEADASYGNLVHPLHLHAADNAVLAWRWRVEQLVENADLTTKAGDDAAAKICVLFDLPLDRLSLSDRTALTLARAALGEELPTQTLCYVWDNKLPAGTRLVNAFTRRIRFIVLESGVAKLAQWVSERRDVVADYRIAFADESNGSVPEIVGVAVGADADNTRGHGMAHVGDITLSQ